MSARSILLSLLLAAASFPGCKRDPAPAAEEPALDDLGAVPDFRLVDQTGAPVTGEGLQGQVYVANTFFTSCRTVCPHLMKQVGVLAERLSGVPVTFVSITVDPDNDTPKALAEYAASLGATPDRWKLLTGDWDAIYALVRGGFRTAMGKPEMEGEVMDITHSGKLFLVDARGHLRGYYDTDDTSLDALAAAVRRLTSARAE